MPKVDEARASDDARSSWVAKPIEDVRAFGVDAGQVPSPPASLPMIVLGPRVEEASSLLVPPLVMSLGAPSRPHPEYVPGPSGEASEGIEEIP